MFKELFTENINKTIKEVKKIIKNTDFDILDPQAYEAEIFNTDAGFGGEKVVRVWLRSTRKKDVADNLKLKDELSKKFDVQPHGATLYIVRNK